MDNSSNDYFEWETLEISADIVEPLTAVFSKNKVISPTLLYALLLRCLGRGRDLQLNTTSRTLLFDVLHAAADQGHLPSRSMIYRIHDYFDMQIPSREVKTKVDWISEAVADGAFFLQSELQTLDPGRLKTAIGKFRELGGYNCFYAPIDLDALSAILQCSMTTTLLSLDKNEPLNPRGDRLLHIVASYDRPELLSDLLDSIGLARVNTTNNHGETPLYRACQAGMTRNVVKLLSCSAKPSITPSPQGPSCLH